MSVPMYPDPPHISPVNVLAKTLLTSLCFACAYDAPHVRALVSAFDPCHISRVKALTKPY